MPLEQSSSKPAFVRNLKAELRAGKPQSQALAIAYAVKRRKRAEGGGLREADEAAMMPETYVNPLAKGLVGGLGHMATIPQRAIESAANYRETGDYDPGPILEAAMLPMGTGAIAGVPMRAGEAVLGAGPIRAYHGSPHDFDAFSLDKIGTGEGAQAYGHGLYFAENEGVAKSYRDNLGTYPAIQKQVFNPDGSPNRPGQVAEWLAIGRKESELEPTLKVLAPDASPEQVSSWVSQGKDIYNNAKSSGKMYEVQINADPEHFLDWDKPLSEQHPKVREALERVNPGVTEEGRSIKSVLPIDSQISNQFNKSGIPGIKYLDQGSRGAGEGSRNYVVFNDKLIDILKKYGIAGLPASGLAAEAAKDDNHAKGGAVNKALDIAYETKRQARADGGGVFEGPIISDVPGRTDKHPMDVAAGSYVIPAESISHMGENNTLAGMKHIKQLGPHGIRKLVMAAPGAQDIARKHRMKRALGGAAREDDTGHPVPVITAGGEHVLSPDEVKIIGGGDISLGHRLLDNWVVTNRRNHIKTLAALDPPAKD